jgi:hypothetical protein
MSDLEINFNNTTPPAPPGNKNVNWQQTGGNPVSISAYAPVFPANIVSVTTTYAAVAGDFVKCDTSSGGFTVMLPLSASNSGKTITIKKISSDNNTLTIACSGSDTLDNQPTQTTKIQNTAVETLADGITTWEIY